MKTRIKRLLVVAMLVCLSLAVVGCMVEESTEKPGVTTTHIDPNKAEKVEKIAEAGVSIAAALSVLWPPLGALSVGLGGLLAAWRKQKSKFVKEQTKAQMFESVTTALVEAIEQYQEDYPTASGNLRKKLVKSIGPEGENVIRELRGLTERI